MRRSHPTSIGFRLRRRVQRLESTHMRGASTKEKSPRRASSPRSRAERKPVPRSKVCSSGPFDSTNQLSLSMVDTLQIQCFSPSSFTPLHARQLQREPFLRDGQPRRLGLPQRDLMCRTHGKRARQTLPRPSRLTSHCWHAVCWCWRVSHSVLAQGFC